MDKIIIYSVRNKFTVGLAVLGLILWGLYSLARLPIAAVPDITNNQVQVITTSPTLATQEVEQFITVPVELSLQNIQNLTEIRSVSRFGLSVVTVVFEEDADIYLSRQLVESRLIKAAENIPPGLGTPELSPISTGLGEIYQYVVRPAPGYADRYSATELRSIQDWIVKRQLAGIPGVAEVNTLGGYLKQYEVAVSPGLLKSVNLTLNDLLAALENSNENTGGAYIEKNPNTYYIRTDGIVKSLTDIENIVVTVRDGRPILIKDVATVKYGKAPRYGALTRDGEEAVGGTVMMLKGENSAAVTARIKERVRQIQKSLPAGVLIEPYLVRDKLITNAIGTVKNNLIEGGLIVIFILVLLLGNWRAGLIVASVIPLAMLFAVAMMRVLGISANLMSLGAIDFGLIVDGAVIITEAVVHRLQTRFAGQKLTAARMNAEVETAAVKIRGSAAFGEIIILMVYIPILALVGIEGKMFKPMAQTVMLAIAGALILSLTYVPMMSALFLNRRITDRRTVADRIVGFVQRLYTPVLAAALRFKTLFVAATVLLFAVSLWVFSRMGGEFIPTLEEGDLALHQILPPGSSLTQSVEVSKIIQQKLMSAFPEIEDVVTKIGSSEIPTDPMPVETGDIMVIMKPRAEWTSADSRREMFEKMEKVLLTIPGLAYEFSQPIQMRFNELMTGSRADIAVKLFGDDLDILFEKAKESEALIRGIAGVGTVKTEQTQGMPQIVIDFDYDKLAQYGLRVREVNRIIRAAFAGEKAGTVYEGSSRFDLTVRLREDYRNDLKNVENLYIPLPNGMQVPLNAVARIQLKDAPMQISRENTNRRIVIGVNVGDTDTETLTENIQAVLEDKIKLPPGYYFTYGGQFENLRAANARLSVAVPLALGLIFVLLYFTFGSVTQALLIFTSVPLSAIGGIWALQLRDMPFSISAGIGFIALFGVAVLNGIVLIGSFNQLKKEGMTDIRQRILTGTRIRLRPVLLTAAVASLGFLPMALSNSGGAEVQRPLATVVIGGLITATFLTLVIIPILYAWTAKRQKYRNGRKKIFKFFFIMLPLLMFTGKSSAQVREISIEQAVQLTQENHPSLRAAEFHTQYQTALQNQPYSLGATELLYQGDGLYRSNEQQVNAFGIRQSIPHPAAVRARNKLQNELVKSADLLQKLTERELIYHVKILYTDIQTTRAEIAALDGHIAWLGEFYDLEKIRAQRGETNNLFALTLQSNLSETEMKKAQKESTAENLEKILQILTGSDTSLRPADTLTLLPPPPFPLPPTGYAVQAAQQNIAIQKADLEVLKATNKPEFTLGYTAQNYLAEGWLSGAEAGIRLQLFNKPLRQKITAGDLQIQAADARYQAEILRTAQYLNQLTATAENQRKTAAFYTRQLNETLPEAERIARLSYRAGELSVRDLLAVIEQSYAAREKRIAAVAAVNKAVIELEYFGGE